MEIINNNNHKKCLYTFGDCLMNDYYNTLYYFDIYHNIKYISFIEHLDYIINNNYTYIVDDFTIIILYN